jgi:hypothetical protein
MYSIRQTDLVVIVLIISGNRHHCRNMSTLYVKGYRTDSRPVRLFSLNHSQDLTLDVIESLVRHQTGEQTSTLCMQCRGVQSACVPSVFPSNES